MRVLRLRNHEKALHTGKKMKFVCAYCKKEADKPTGEVNRALRKGLPLHCNRTCAGLGRRDTRTLQEKREAKRIYDTEYRSKNKEMLKAKKAKFYKETMTPEKRKREREYRKATMARHVEYCRRPEYKQYKRTYDRVFRAKKYYGDFWECFLLTQDIDSEIATRIDNYNLYLSKGTLNKSQQRKRDYERTIGKYA